MNAKDTIYQIIHQQGYITVDRYFYIASDYYYKNNQAVSLDFTTSPEISQLFGEIIGLWAVTQWIAKGSPKQINLLELGPGKGTLMNDLLRSTSHIQGFHESLNIYLYDINPTLIKIQKEKLHQYNKSQIYWIDNLDQIKKLPTIIIGNEFFDCLPVKQYILKQNVWHERVITFDKYNTLSFSKIATGQEINIKLRNQHCNAIEGSIVEISHDISKFIQLLSNINCLSYLFIDYGYYIDPMMRRSNQYNSTLQAVKSHQHANIFDYIGKTDLTFHVDFWDLQKNAKQYGYTISSLTNQREFLMQNGIEHRFNMLIRKQDLKIQYILEKQYIRLTELKAMGDLFKVIILDKDN